jgi:hypothetical protein
MCPCGQRSETGTHLSVRLWGVALVSRENLLFWYDYRTAIRRVAKTLGWSVFWASTYRYFALPGPSANYCCCVLLLLDKLFSSLLPLLPVAIECSTHSSRSCLQGHLQRDAPAPPTLSWRPSTCPPPHSPRSKPRAWRAAHPSAHPKQRPNPRQETGEKYSLVSTPGD